MVIGAIAQKRCFIQTLCLSFQFHPPVLWHWTLRFPPGLRNQSIFFRKSVPVPRIWIHYSIRKINWWPNVEALNSNDAGGAKERTVTYSEQEICDWLRKSSRVGTLIAVAISGFKLVKSNKDFRYFMKHDVLANFHFQFTLKMAVKGQFVNAEKAWGFSMKSPKPF